LENNGSGEWRPQTKLSVYSLNTKTRSDTAQSIAGYFWKIYRCSNFEGGKMAQDAVTATPPGKSVSLCAAITNVFVPTQIKQRGRMNHILKLRKSNKTWKHCAANYSFANNHH
jgi:hypothetical protein